MNQEPAMIIIGLGEIGEPIFNILRETYPQTDSFDIKEQDLSGRREKYDIINICFGYKVGEEEQYKKWVKEYQDRFLKKGGLTVIHATVEPGMSRSLNAIHSPVIGQHPNMEEFVRVVPKMFSGPRADEVADLFRRAGLKVYIFDRQEETEWGKLFLTEYYRMLIEFCQRVKRVADKNGLSFHNIYTLPNMIFNQGYQAMGYPEYTHPILQPMMMPIGGHCVSPNAELIASHEK